MKGEVGKVSEREAPPIASRETQRLVLPLAVRGDVRGGAAVAIRGLGPLYIQV